MRVHVCACLCVHVLMRTRLYARVSMCVYTELQGQEEPCSRSRSLQLTLHPGPACTYPRHSRKDVTLSPGSTPALRVPVAVPSSCLSAAPVSVRAAAEPVCYFREEGQLGVSLALTPPCRGAPWVPRVQAGAAGSGQRNQQRPGEPGPAPGGAEPLARSPRPRCSRRGAGAVAACSAARWGRGEVPGQPPRLYFPFFNYSAQPR